MTAMHLHQALNIKPFTVMSSLRKMTERGVLMCLTPTMRHSRVYWLTTRGERIQRELRRYADLRLLEHDVPAVDWTQYAFTCFSHRMVILSVLTEPLTPALIKRRARRRYPWIRMSASNVREAVIRLKQRAIVESLLLPKERHPRYVLTPMCHDFPRLLQRVVWRRGP